MNVTCPACSTRYTVPDDKVVGRRARMQCKKCGGAIAIDGTARHSSPTHSTPGHSAPLHSGPLHSAPGHSAPGHSAPGHSAPWHAAPLSAATHAAPRTPEWNVAQPSGRRDVLTTAQLLDLYETDQVEPGALVWRAGMDNWVPPYDVPELATAFATRGMRVPGAGLESSFDEDEATRVGALPIDIKALDAKARAADAAHGAWQEPGREQQPSFSDATRSISADQAQALKRQAMRSMEDFGDLGAKSDGLIDEVTRAIDSLPRVLPPIPQPPVKRLTSSSPEEATRVFDSRALREESETEEATRVYDTSHADTSEEEATRVFDPSRGADEDEATKMFTGGAPTPAAAIEHQGKVPAPQPPPAPRPPPSRPGALPAQHAPAPQAAPAPRPLPPGPAPAPLARPSAPTAGNAQHVPAHPIPEPAPVSAPRVVTPFGTVSYDEVEIPSIGEPTRLSQRAAVTVQRSALQGSRLNPVFVVLFVLLAVASGIYILKPELMGLGPAPAPRVEASGPPFDANAAGAALAEAANTASRCKVDGGPKGPGRVHVKYVPTGRAISASVSDPYAGTDVGECLVNVFQSTTVPPFGGKPVIVGKNFAIE